MKKLLFLAVLGMLTMLVAAPAFAQSGGPSGADGSFNCEDFEFQEDAQDFFDQDTSDPDGLDGPPGEAFTGEPGVACEELPSRGDMEQPMMDETMMEDPSTTDDDMMGADDGQYEPEPPVVVEPPAPVAPDVALPDTGGPAPLMPLLGVLLVAGGLVMRRR